MAWLRNADSDLGKDIQIVDEFQGYKLVKDMTLPEIRMEILSPTNETLATSTDMPKIQQAWDNAKAGGGKTGSMRIANDVEEVDHLDFKFPDVPDDTVFNYINDLRWSSGNADESVIRFQMESDGAIAVLADGAQITVLERGVK